MKNGRTLGSLAAVLLLLCVSQLCVAQSGSSQGSSLELRHITYSVTNLHATGRFLTDVLGWRRRPLVLRVPDAGSAVGNESAFFDANGVWIELRAHSTLARARTAHPPAAAGAIIELNFWTAEYDATLAALKSQGVRMRNAEGETPRDIEPTVKHRMTSHDAVNHPHAPSVAYFPAELSGSTRIAIVDAAFEPNGRSAARDRTRQQGELNPAIPRISHVAILVEDLEKSASFYAGVMKLRRSSKIFELGADENPEIGGMKLNFVHTGGPWLELVQPSGPGPVLTALTEEGDGVAAELVVEVDDLGQYFDDVQRKGIVLTDIAGKPFVGDQKYMVIDPFGTKIAYFPTDASQGMVIEVIERGPRDADILHLRDAAWKP